MGGVRTPSTSVVPPGEGSSTPPPALVLAGHEVHLWIASLDEVTHRLRDQWLSLPESVQARVNRLATAELRRRAIAGEVLRRRVLSRYTGVAPEEIRFRRTPGGKPELAEAHPVQFSLSHSGPLFLLGVRRGGAIGVDVERIRPVRDPISMARRVFSPEVVEELERAPDGPTLHRMFLHRWTQHEALLKGKGVGLRTPARSAPAGAASPPEAASSAEAASPEGWRTTGVPLPQESALAAVATEGAQFCPIRRFPWNPEHIEGPKEVR